MAGAAGFEPAHGGTKNRCLTAWPRPNESCVYHKNNWEKLQPVLLKSSKNKLTKF